jgi:hypothetical protein
LWEGSAATITLGHAGGLKYVRTQAELPIAGFDELKAHCGGSWHVFGGGAQPSGPTITEQLESTAPFDGDDANGWLDDGWLGGASNLGSVPQTLKTYAICSHDAPDYPTITSDTGGVGGINGAGQGCEPQIVGGGIRPSTTPGNTHLLETKPLAELTDWEGSLYQDAGPADAELEVYAICTGGMDLIERAKTRDAESGPTSAEVSVRCPSGTHVTGGGSDIHADKFQDAAASWLTDTRPFDGNDPGAVPDDGWTARAQLAAGGDGVSAYAVCVDP